MLSFKAVVTILCAIFTLLPNSLAGDCTNINKVPICHRGAGVGPDHKAVSICVDFGALWGHIAQHPHDYVGECNVDIEDNLNVWACNAGLRHKDHNDRLCFDLNQNGARVPNCNSSDNCVCSGDALPQSVSRFDYFSFEIANYISGIVPSTFTESTQTAGAPNFSQASTSQGGHILREDRGVTFSLGSERFGADYFVDLCWEVLDPSLIQETMKVEVDMALAADVFNSNQQSYLVNSQVSQVNGIFCDKSSSLGAYSYSSQPVFTTSETPFPGGTRSFSTNVSNARSCFVRMMFRENQENLLRPHDLQQVTIHSSLNVEPLNPLPPKDEGLTFCHVQRVRGNSFQCTQRSFPDTASLRSFMTTGYNNIPDWRQDHNLNYRGQCRTDCRPLTGNEGNQ